MRNKKGASWFRRVMFLSMLLSLCALFLPLDLLAKGKNPGPDQLYKEARQAFYANKSVGDPAKDRKAWTEIGALFQKVYDRFPNSHRADDALFSLARIYLDLFTSYGAQKDLNQALGFFLQVTAEYPDSRLADDAQFKVGEIFLRVKKNRTRALKTFKKIIELYPHGDKVKAAQREIAALKKMAPTVHGKGSVPVEINAIRHWSNPTYTRVVIDLADSAEFKEMRLPDPDRFFVDIHNAVISRDLRDKPISVNDGLLLRVRASQFKPDVVRVVLDVKNCRDFEVFSYENPFRVVMDIWGEPTKRDKKGEKKKKPAKTSLPSPVKKAGVARKKSGVARVIIDAGHGGKDKGATGYKGIQEKRVVLDIVLRLKKALKRNLDCDVVLTREKDVFLSLEERTAIANTRSGDIFVSIHANSAPRKAARGIETYFLSNALSARALETASRENMMATKEMSDDIRFILSEMLAKSNMNESDELAFIIQKNLIRGLKKSFSKVKDLGVKGGPFYVLHGANMPSVLVEVGFLSNPKEATRLKNPVYRQKLALFLYKGIKEYLKDFKLAKRSE